LSRFTPRPEITQKYYKLSVYNFKLQLLNGIKDVLMKMSRSSKMAGEMKLNRK
jgi:hypothetical protein